MSDHARTGLSRPGSRREVGCALGFEVVEPALVAFQVAPATTAGTVVDERITCTTADGATRAVREVAGEGGGRVHLVSMPVGPLSFEYSATVVAHDPDRGSIDGEASDDGLPSLDALVGLRQSRYCPSDALAGFAVVEFPDASGASAVDLAHEVASWVFERVTYTLGSSGPLDTALDTLHSGVGVCRDFAHLAITLCRALGVPARFAAVYAPGISPMDFHAVAEMLTPHGWLVVDPSRRAPRQTLVRIATGRDATDTSFAMTLHGEVELVASRVFASTDGVLPADEHLRLMHLV